jgi:hypothetical protein
VITADPQLAPLQAQRALERLSAPRKIGEPETWVEGLLISLSRAGIGVSGI